MITFTIDFLLRTIGILLGLIFVILIYLIIRRIIEVNHKRKIRAYIQKKEDDWFRFFMQEEANESQLFPRGLKPYRLYQYEAVEEILLSYVNNVMNPPRLETIQRYANRYLKQYYAKQLKSRRWSKRMNALHRIIDFRMNHLLEPCKQLERRKLSDEEHFLLLRIYALFDAETFMKSLFDKELQLIEFEYKKLLANIPTSLFKQVMDRIDDLPLQAQLAMIDLLGSLREIDLIPQLEKKLNHELSEIRIRTLKAIAEIGFVEDPEIIYPFVTSPIWVERMMAAQILGNIYTIEALDYLMKLLHDESWWVRSKAAHAIGKLKNGREILEQIVATGNDRYAIDMANEVLRKGL